MTTKVEAAIKNFYKMKAKYEKQYKVAKNRILKSGLSLSDKRVRLKRLKQKCLGCKRNVGTTFAILNQGRNLTARCGSEEAPCSLNIDIERGEFAYIPTLIEALKIDLENNKTAIIQLKLDILFSLTTEEEIAEPFAELKQKYKEYGRILTSLDLILSDNQLVSIHGVGEERIIKKEELIAIKKEELSTQITEVQKLIIEYLREEAGGGRLGGGDERLIGLHDETLRLRAQITKGGGGGGGGAPTHLENAIEIYIDTIIPLLTTIRENMYEISTVLKQGSIFKLVQIKTKLANLQLTITPPRIVSNIIKGK